MTLSSSSEHTFPVANVAHLLEVVKRWDVSGDDILRGSGIDREALAEPRARVAIPTLMALLERARHLTGEPALGLYIGLHTRASLYGHLGFAIMSAKTIREAVELCLKFGSIVTTSIRMRLREERRVASLIVEEHANFGSARDIVLIASLVSWWQVSRSLTGRDLKTSVADFAMPAPSYAGRLALQSLRMRFDRPVSQLTFDARSLDLPYTMPDATSVALAREQCQRELDAMGLSAGLPERVRALIPRPEGGFRGLEEVASVLHRSVRTLKRQLGAHGVRFSELRDRALCERAFDLLRLPDRSLADVSTQIGYSNVTNFERAFQRWTGKTPAEYRRDHSRPLRVNGAHAAGTDVTG